MGKIALLKSSSTHLAIFFSVLIGLTVMLIVNDIVAMTGPDIDDTQMMHLWVKLGMLVTVCAGLFILSFYVTKRINIICSVAEKIIKSGDLSQRIPVLNKWDDLSTLSYMLNMLLSEIEQSLNAVRQVSDNIAHDLRTPLARLRNDLEQTRKMVHDAGNIELTEQVDYLLEESDHIMSTFSALLRIGNIEDAKRHSRFTSLTLRLLLQDVVDLYEPIAMDKSQHLMLEIDEDFTLNGDKDLLFQAVANTLDNALKYTAEGGDIRLRLHRTEKRPTISIYDNGVGVSDANKEQLFRRFFRVEECRHTPGTGLGLSLVKAIIKLHKGNIVLEDNQPSGLVVHLQL